MGIKSIITDKATNLSAEVVDGVEKNALVVATRPLKTYEDYTNFFSNSDYGINMNQDASAGGTPEKIHDGTDSVLWTATDIVGGGKTTFNSTDQNHTAAGTKSIKVDNSPVNDIFQIAKGSDMTMSNYVSLSLWIYVDKDWGAGDDIELYGWDTDLNVIVGIPIKLQNYFSWFSFGSWHKITVALTEMGDASASTTLDAIRIGIVAKDVKSPKFYIDDIQFEQTGSPIEFIIKPSLGTWLYITDYTIVVADAIASTLADATMPNLAYDKILGETLVSGINYRRIQKGEVKFNLILHNILNLIGLPNATIQSGSDGTNTWVMIKIRNVEPILLKAEDEDNLSLTISEDLTGLLQFRVSVAGMIDSRTKT